VAFGATKQAANLINGVQQFLISDVTPLTLGTEIKVEEDINWFVKLFRDPHATLEM